MQVFISYSPHIGINGIHNCRFGHGRIKLYTDNYIVENATEKDLVITRDIPLANRLVEKNISVINDRGTKFTQNNIKELLSIRNFNHELAQIGITGEKVKNYGQKEIAKFSNCLDKELQIKIKNNNNFSICIYFRNSDIRFN